MSTSHLDGADAPGYGFGEALAIGFALLAALAILVPIVTLVGLHVARRLAARDRISFEFSDFCVVAIVSGMVAGGLIHLTAAVLVPDTYMNIDAALGFVVPAILLALTIALGAFVLDVIRGESM